MSTVRKLSVVDFGAIGDGTRDDTAAIQACINHINNTGSAEDTSCFFPPGTWKITSAITVPNGLYLEGTGDDAKIQLGNNDPSGTVTGFSPAASATVSFSELKFVKPGSDANAATYRAIVHGGTAGQVILEKITADTGVQVVIPASVSLVQDMGRDIETPAAQVTQTYDSTKEFWTGGNQPLVLKGTADPSTGDGVAAPEGSVYLQYASGAGLIYYKSGAADTGWTQVSAGGAAFSNLAELNALVSDATLDDSSASRTPSAHAASHTDGSDDVQSATSGQKGLMTAAYAGKLDGIEALADVTDATNVAAAGAVMDSDISPAEGFLRKTGAGAYTAVKSNLSASTNPTASDDTGSGYSVGSLWINTTADEMFVCVDASAAAAVWISTTRQPNVVVSSGTHNMAVTDRVILVDYTATGAVTVNLAAVATLGSGIFVRIIDSGGLAGTNNITIDANSDETISGSATFVISGNYNAVTLYCDGVEWFVV